MEISNAPQFPIRRSWILSVFLIIPAVALFAMWDIYFNDQQLQPHLQLDSLFLPLYLLFFELPHIIAGLFGFFQTRYIAHYKKHLLFGVPGLLVAFAVLTYFNFYLAVIIYLIATLYHVIKQQTGIALFFRVPKNRWHSLWGWLIILGVSGLYIAIHPGLVTSSIGPLLVHTSQLLLAGSLLVGGWMFVQTSTKSGRLYVASTMAMVIVSYALLVAGYIFLSILIFRVIHDITAFIFYITHEMNSNYHSVQNWLYKFVPFLPWSLLLLVPLAAIMLGLLVRSTINDPQFLFSILMLLGFAHYYLESIIWKRDGIHRENISIV